MLIYVNQAMTSHQYNIWTKDIVWEQRYILLLEFCDHLSLDAQVSYCCPSSSQGKGIQSCSNGTHYPMGTVLRAKARFLFYFIQDLLFQIQKYVGGQITLCLIDSQVNNKEYSYQCLQDYPRLAPGKGGGGRKD